MFKKHALQVSLVTAPQETPTTDAPAFIIPKDDIIDVAKQLMITTAICIGAVFAAVAVVEAGTEIATYKATHEKK